MEETVRLPMLSGATVSFSKPRKTELWGVIVPRQRLGWSHSPLKDGCPPRMDASANSFAGLPRAFSSLLSAQSPCLILGFSLSLGLPVMLRLPLRAMHLAPGCDSVLISKSWRIFSCHLQQQVVAVFIIVTHTPKKNVAEKIDICAFYPTLGTS